MVTKIIIPSLTRYSSNISFPATLFIYPNYISNGGAALTWDELKIMAADPMISIQSHTYTHPDLARVSRRNGADAKLKHEIVDSRNTLEQKLGIKIDTFAYPYGVFNPKVLSLTKAAGYRSAFTIGTRPIPYIGEKPTDMWTVPRIMVNRGDSLQLWASRMNMPAPRKKEGAQSEEGLARVTARSVNDEQKRGDAASSSPRLRGWLGSWAPRFWGGHLCAGRTSDDIIRVVGSARRPIKSDFIIWRGKVGRTAPQMAAAYAQLEGDMSKVTAYLRAKGIESREIFPQSISTQTLYQRTLDANGNEINDEFTLRPVAGYRLEQEIEVRSAKLDLLDDLSRKSSELLARGVPFESQEPLYLYTKLSDLKVQMQAEAAKDARSRAQGIAGAAGASLGEVRWARMSAPSLTPLYSGSDNDGGVGRYQQPGKENYRDCHHRLRREITTRLRRTIRPPAPSKLSANALARMQVGSNNPQHWFE